MFDDVFSSLQKERLHAKIDGVWTRMFVDKESCMRDNDLFRATDRLKRTVRDIMADDDQCG